MSSPKIATSEAARLLRDHPANVVRSLSEMVSSLQDCWPEVDEGFVDTLRTLRREVPPGPSNQAVAPPSPTLPVTIPTPVSSETALRILDKLERKDKWGGNAIGWDTLRNHYCQGLRDLDDAVDELVEEGLLLSGANRRGPYSLNPARKGEIDTRLVKHRSERR